MRPPPVRVRVDLMSEQGTTTDQPGEPILEALRGIPARMHQAWNRGDVEGFFADFADDAVFAELEGTVYRERSHMIQAHQALFATVLKGSQLVQGEVVLAQIVSPGVGVVHSRVKILMPGEVEPPATRTSMQLYVAVRRDQRWIVTVLQNGRLLPLPVLAAMESLPAA